MVIQWYNALEQHSCVDVNYSLMKVFCFRNLCYRWRVLNLHQMREAFERIFLSECYHLK